MSETPRDQRDLWREVSRTFEELGEALRVHLSADAARTPTDPTSGGAESAPWADPTESPGRPGEGAGAADSDWVGPTGWADPARPGEAEGVEDDPWAAATDTPPRASTPATGPAGTAANGSATSGTGGAADATTAGAPVGAGAAAAGSTGGTGTGGSDAAEPDATTTTGAAGGAGAGGTGRTGAGAGGTGTTATGTTATGGAGAAGATGAGDAGAGAAGTSATSTGEAGGTGTGENGGARERGWREWSGTTGGGRFASPADWDSARESVRDLGSSVRRIAAQAGDAARDPHVRDSAQRAARSLGDAIVTTVEEFAAELRNRVQNPRWSDTSRPPEPPPVAPIEDNRDDRT